MQRPQFVIGTAPPDTAMSPKRIVSLGLVGALHLAIIYAVVTGLAQRIVKHIPPVLQATVIETAPPEKHEMIVPKPQMVQPTVPDTISPPDIVIDTQSVAPPVPMAPAAPTAPPVSAAAASIDRTHTTPPYPDAERRNGVQGTVRLHIYVTPQGTVSNATVVTSSGNAELDSNAVSWVIAHWKYKPALASGTPVAAETDANVVYDLKRVH
jgi:protein TonB